MAIQSVGCEIVWKLGLSWACPTQTDTLKVLKHQAEQQATSRAREGLTPSFLGITFQIASKKAFSGDSGPSSSSNTTPTTVAQLPERSGFIAAQAALQERLTTSRATHV